MTGGLDTTMTDFERTILTREELREVIPEPSELVTRKVLAAGLDRHCGDFIRRCPFVLIASSDREGNFDISPKGDPAGFVKIIDEKTLVIPDRPGNNRADTLENILLNPKVGLIFLIPGKGESLRVSGAARIVGDHALLESMAVNGRTPKLAIVVDVTEAFFHCSKAMIRSKLWKPQEWPSLDGLPRLAQTMVDAGRLDLKEKDMHAIVVNDEEQRLY